MEPIEEKLLQYHQLGDDARREVDAYLNEHPELRPLVERAQDLDRLFEEVRHVVTDPPGDEVLAYVLVTRRIQPEQPIPEALQALFDRVEARLDAEPRLHRRYQELAARLQRLEAEHDAVAQFERLTGTRLDGPEEDNRANVVSEESQTFALAAEPAAVYRVPSEQRPPAERRATDRPAAIRPLVFRATRWAVAAVLGLFVLYGLLAVVSRVSQSPLDRLAWIEPELLDVEGYSVQFRGDVQPEQLPTEEAYLEALALLQEAQSRTLGLFPRFDAERLRQAEERLRMAAQDEDASFVQGEARYLLAKVLLAQGRTGEAWVMLDQIAASNSRHAAAAASLLAELRDVQDG